MAGRRPPCRDRLAAGRPTRYTFPVPDPRRGAQPPILPALLLALALSFFLRPADLLAPSPASGVMGIASDLAPLAAEPFGPLESPGAAAPAAAPDAASGGRTATGNTLPVVDDPDVGNGIVRAPETLTGYRWPLTQVRITQKFGPAKGGSAVVDGKAFHDGIDLATFCSDHVLAAHDGVVLAAGRRYDDFLGWDGDLSAYYARLDAGNLWGTLPIVVVIDDGNGYRSIYAHMWKLTVKAGDIVKAGQLIGYEGATGHATGCHLHYGLFNPDATGRFGIDPAVVAKLLVPAQEVARVDPQRVFPAPPGATPAPSATP